jgi:hypothetical protein
MLSLFKFYQRYKRLKELKFLQNLVEEDKKINKKIDEKSVEKKIELDEYATEGNRMMFDYGSYNYFILHGQYKLVYLKKKKIHKAFKRYVLFCFIAYCIFLIFCYDVFEDYQFLYLYEFHKWW